MQVAQRDQGHRAEELRQATAAGAKVAKDGAWTFNVRSTIKLGAGRYRIIAVGLDNSGAFGNSAPSKDAVHRFTLVRN